MTARETIFALSSGAPPAAISIVRVSGPGAAAALKRLAGVVPEPRRATLRSLRDEDGGLLDRALLLWFPGPGSATGEDLAELHLHGGRATVAAVLGCLGHVPGCRHADAGEFTRRAFLNGRIDLAQAEALSDLLAAETEAQRRHAVRGTEGSLGRSIERWGDRLTDLVAGIEADLDFSEEGDVAVRVSDPHPAIAALAAEIVTHCDLPVAERMHDGFRVVIAGPPNSGKSSLLNALARRDAAIVSPMAGTTRDRIEVPLAVAGLPVLLIDTAGLRDTVDPIEQLGVERTAAAVAEADVVLWLGEPCQSPKHSHVIVVHPRCDLAGRDQLPPGADVATSINGTGLAELLVRITALRGDSLALDDAVLLSLRQRDALHAAASDLTLAAGAEDVECVADMIHSALKKLKRVTWDDRGHVVDAIFSRFCLGK